MKIAVGIVFLLAIVFLLPFGLYKLLLYLTDMPLWSAMIALALFVIQIFVIVYYGGGIAFMVALFSAFLSSLS